MVTTRRRPVAPRLLPTGAGTQARSAGNPARLHRVVAPARAWPTSPPPGPAASTLAVVRRVPIPDG